MRWIKEPKDKDVIDMTHTMYPSYMQAHVFNGAPHSKERSVVNLGSKLDTTYIVAVKGDVFVSSDDGFQVMGPEGTVVCIPGSYDIRQAVGSVAIAITRCGYRGMFGATKCEEKGRLAYIDGCSDTALIQPNRLGDPCLNYLHFPVHINQTQHLHPSIRMGIVMGGGGQAWKATTEHDKGWTKDLTPGGMFCLEESEIHSFRTNESHMNIIAYHPDSDTGPTDTNHPMLNRTYIDHGK